MATLNHSSFLKTKTSTFSPISTSFSVSHSTLPSPRLRPPFRRSAFPSAAASGSPPPTQPPVVRKRTRYRRQYPGETEGITEEMRFVAMRLRNINGKRISKSESDGEDSDDGEAVSDADSTESDDEDDCDDGDGDTWRPSMEGFLNYLVDSEVVFNTIERIVDDSNDVAYAYFRKTGLERSEGLSKDLEFFRQKGIVIPEPSNNGVLYGNYLVQLSEKSASMFICHFYNIYFSHISGGRVIGKQVCEALLDGTELEFYKWDGDVLELLQGVRGKVNMLGEHWSRYEKNKCLREASKSFKFLGQIIRLIIL